MTDRGRLVDWLSILLLCASAVLCGLLEVAFIGQFYVGATIVPVVVLASIVTNTVLPLLGHRAVGATRGAVLPVLFWLITVLGLSIYTRPEGDLFVTSAFDQDWAFYGMLLLGTVAGFISIVRAGGLAPRPMTGARTAPAERRSEPAARRAETQRQATRPSGTSKPKPRGSKRR